MDRRQALAAMAGIGVLGAAGGVWTAGQLGGTRATASVSGGLPVLGTDDDWATALAKNRRIQLVPGATYTLRRSVELPDGCYIAGNGAVVTVSGTGVTALTATGRSDITIGDVRFVGQRADAAGSSMVASHVAVALSRCTDARVRDCRFSNWRGAGVVVRGSAADDYFGYRVKIQNNSFDRCYVGLSTTDRSEYSTFTGNSLTYCRLAVWNSSGNWTVNDNNIAACYGAYYSIAATSPYGAQSTDNWNHGSLVGNTFNHSNLGGRDRWDRHRAFRIGGRVRDPGAGLVLEGVRPPTFSGNTVWYTDITAADLRSTRWLLSGSALSHTTVRCRGRAPVHLVGTQSRGAEAAPRLSGNVRDLLPRSGMPDG
ncbi:right-handed parallel beta-helix repeat-containing protein [Streptomyces sp. TP-A0874]|uniref:right-handed parallel beta-helix repeat-containing protein n=1 Tax=Streptomyces sp. TP-A0874 TaxID=549819 RepID=UPI0008534324|nr:NosD domain-containing protein [Streptomyces sp. TP-A0874]